MEMSIRLNFQYFTQIFITFKDYYNIKRHKMTENQQILNNFDNHSDKINILCLHGCNQTSIMFEQLMKNFIQISKTYTKNKNKTFSWNFIEARYDHSIGGKTWYNVELDVSKIGSIHMDDNMVKSTLDELDNKINELKIDVLIGFSQGGNVVDTYLVNRPNNIKCAVIFSGYDLIDANRKQVDTPVLNVYSESDTIVPCQYTPKYKNMTVKIHEKGHKLPTSNPFMREIIEWMWIKCS